MSAIFLTVSKYVADKNEILAILYPCGYSDLMNLVKNMFPTATPEKLNIMF